MTQAFTALLVLLLAVSLCSAQQATGKPSQPSTPASTAVQPAAPSPAAPQTSTRDTAQAGPAQAPTPPDYSQEAYVVQHFSESMRFESDGTGVVQTDTEIKIVSESGVQALGQIKVGYSALSDKIDIAYVRVHK